MKKLMHILLYLVFIIFVTEAGLRVVAHFVYRTPLLDVRRFVGDELLKWKMNPGYHGPIGQYNYGCINKYGCLGDELEEPKSQDLTRVAIVGGSVVFGTGSSRMEKNLCHVLKRMLNQAPGGNRYEVVNAGVPGYSSWHGRNFVEHRLASLQPDILVFAYGWNDSFHDILEDKAPQDTDWQDRVLVQGPNFFYGSTAIGYAFRPLILKFTDLLHVSQNAMLTEGSGVSRVSLADFRDNLEAVRAWCLKHSIQLVLMTEPEGRTASDNWPELRQRHHPYLNIIREVGGEGGIPVADAAAAFDSLDGSQIFRDLKDDPLHPNDHGQEVMAQVIYRTLEQAGFLGLE